MTDEVAPSLVSLWQWSPPTWPPVEAQQWKVVAAVRRQYGLNTIPARKVRR